MPPEDLRFRDPLSVPEACFRCRSCMDRGHVTEVLTNLRGSLAQFRQFGSSFQTKGRRVGSDSRQGLLLLGRDQALEGATPPVCRRYGFLPRSGASSGQKGAPDPTRHGEEGPKGLLCALSLHRHSGLERPWRGLEIRRRAKRAPRGSRRIGGVQCRNGQAGAGLPSIRQRGGQVADLLLVATGRAESGVPGRRGMQ